MAAAASAAAARAANGDLKKPDYILLLTALLAAALTSCLPEHGRQGQQEEGRIVSIPRILTDSSIAFTQNQVHLDIDTFMRTLNISLHYDLPRTAFPVVKKFSDTLTETAFLFELKADGQSILSDYLTNENKYGIHLAEGPMRYTTDTMNLATPGTADLYVPFYAFYHLKKGLHNMEVTVSQDIFRSNHTSDVPCYDSVFNHPSVCQVRYRSAKQLVRCTARFKMVVPSLHRTVLYTNRIEVKNDSTFNPYSSDNTLWKSSLPDVYWSVLYPLRHSYANSDYETSTTEYTRRDTVNLYHYSTTDSVCFAVYDHDGLSRDDGLGYKNFCLHDLIVHKGLNTTFWYIKTFSLDADYRGIVNP